jgi:hypothetical protein
MHIILQIGRFKKDVEIFINSSKTTSIPFAAMLAKQSVISVGLFNNSAANNSIYASRADITHFGFGISI